MGKNVSFTQDLKLEKTPLLTYVADIAIPVLELKREEKNVFDPRKDCLFNGWHDASVDLRASYGADNSCKPGVPCKHGDEVTLIYGRAVEDFLHKNGYPVNSRNENVCYRGRKLEELLSNPAIFTESLSVNHSHLLCGHEHGFTQKLIRLDFARNVLKDYVVMSPKKEQCCQFGNRYVFDYYSGPLENFAQQSSTTKLLVGMEHFQGLGKASQVIEEFMKVAAGRKLSESQLAELSKGKDITDSIKWKNE